MLPFNRQFSKLFTKGEKTVKRRLPDNVEHLTILCLILSVLAIYIDAF